MSKAIKIVHKKEDRIKVYFPHNRVYSLAKGFYGTTLAEQLLQGNLSQIKVLNNLEV